MSVNCCCFVCVNEAEAGIVENCGKYERVLPPGLACLTCPCESYRATISLKIQHLEISCDTKTKDNVFVQVIVAVQFKVIEDKVSSAFYKLTDPHAQIRSYVNDVVRSTIPVMELDAAFSSKEHVATNVMDRLSHLMLEYGYQIIACLVVDINPDNRVKFAMNEIMGKAC
jgi:regulator of protease activity HflC (stomatin/prohibitin superfamily)